MPKKEEGHRATLFRLVEQGIIDAEVAREGGELWERSLQIGRARYARI